MAKKKSKTKKYNSDVDELYVKKEVDTFDIYFSNFYKNVNWKLLIILFVSYIL